ncbi:Uncharacterised protein [Bordetella pertussis]|nr:Uncharacterised protein [Bordetella pertussis]
MPSCKIAAANGAPPHDAYPGAWDAHLKQMSPFS